MTEFIKGERDRVEGLMSQWENYRDGYATYDDSKPIEWQTEKELVKVVPCVECATPIGVNTFYAPAIARCSEHGGGEKRASREAKSGTGSQAIVQPGKTAPEKAVNLADCLINKQFAVAACPLCAEAMELKSVSQNTSYGPRHLQGYKGNVPIYEQQPGETVMLQCNSCKCVLSMSTSHTVVYRRQNEPKQGTNRSSGWVGLLGTREEAT